MEIGKWKLRHETSDVTLETETGYWRPGVPLRYEIKISRWFKCYLEIAHISYNNLIFAPHIQWIFSCPAIKFSASYRMITFSIYSYLTIGNNNRCHSLFIVYIQNQFKERVGIGLGENNVVGTLV